MLFRSFVDMVLVHEPPERAEKLLTESHSHRSCVCCIFCSATDSVSECMCDEKTAVEDFRDGGQKEGGNSHHECNRGIFRSKDMVDPVAHVAKRRAQSCETDDRQAHPLRESQTDGVAAEMVTELMGENPSELFVCQIARSI